MKTEKDDQYKVVATNRKAYHDYFIEEKLEAGMVLRGTEVKSLREGRVNLQDSYASVHDEEVYLHHCHISPYSHGNIMNHEPLRARKLLLHRKEINKLIGKTQQKGLTLVPLRIYFNKRRAGKNRSRARERKEAVRPPRNNQSPRGRPRSGAGDQGKEGSIGDWTDPRRPDSQRVDEIRHRNSYADLYCPATHSCPGCHES